MGYHVFFRVTWFEWWVWTSRRQCDYICVMISWNHIISLPLWGMSVERKKGSVPVSLEKASGKEKCWGCSLVTWSWLAFSLTDTHGVYFYAMCSGGRKKGCKMKSNVTAKSHFTFALSGDCARSTITLELERPHEGHVTAGSLEKECVKQYVGI